MLRNIFLIFITTICSFFGDAQDTIYFSTFGSNGLFRNIENPVYYYSNKSVIVRSDEKANILKINKYSFTVEPKSDASSITLFAIDSVSGDTLERLQQKLRNTPPPYLFLGNAWDGSSIRLLPNAPISFRYKESVPIENHFRILYAEIVTSDSTFNIIGDRVPEDIVNQLNELRRIHGTPNLTIQLRATITCPDCAMISKTISITLI